LRTSYVLAVKTRYLYLYLMAEYLMHLC